MKTTMINTKALWVLTLLFSLLVLIPKVNGQPSCPATCANVNIQFSNSCDDITVTPSQVSTYLEPGCNYELTFVRPGNPTAPPTLTSADIGSSVMYTLTVVDQGTACMGEINVTAGGGPVVFCPDGPIEINCGVSVLDLPAPEAVSCNGPVSSFAQVLSGLNGSGDCMAPVYREVVVRYTYSNGSGQNTICDVTYHLLSTDPAQIVAPADVTLECSAGLDVSTAALGVPTIGGEPFSDFQSCNLMLSDPVDTEHSGCGNTRIINRTWTIMDWCNPAEPSVLVQVITITDTTAPEISLSESEIFASALPTQCASGIVMLPPATVSDNCTDANAINVSMSVPTVGFINTNGGAVNNIPVGNHIVTYTATDLCGLTSTATLQLVISDDTGPNVVCNTATTVTLNNLGLATVPATIFNNGSSDNCGPVFFKVRRMDSSDCDPLPIFDDAVSFCCTDVDGPVTVILRVYDVNPGSGPVTENHLVEHSNECMVEVTVQDKTMPSVVCPGDVTVDCAFDLDFYLTNDIPVATDNCTSNLQFDVSLNTNGLNACGLGTAIRTIQYTDGANTLTCTNQILVENVDVPNGISIVWPENIMLNSCGGVIHPDSLPTNASRPVITVSNCAQIATRFEDAVFDIVDDACFKVIRTWEVMDWCAFEASGGTAGIFRHHQMIKVLDDQAPLILGVADVTADFEADESCNFPPTQVNIAPITAEDCTPVSEMRFRYRIDFGNNGVFDTGFTNGNNASGIYPPGVSRVQFRVDDLCGNHTTAELLVTVNIADNKKPTPVLRNLQTALMPGTQMVSIQASMFNAESFDNCTPSNQLIYSFSPDINDRNRVFTCDDLDTAFVTIYVWDAAGNFDFSTVALAIADNGGDCPDGIGGGGLVVSGRIVNENDNVIESVTVQLTQGQNGTFETGADGRFIFSELPSNKPYELSPNKSLNPRNGVSVMDLLLIQRHILGVERLNSPYKLLAADANRSGTISGADLIAIQRVLLGHSTSFDGQAAWRFVDAAYTFTDPSNPFLDNIPEKVSIPNLETATQRDFIGIKMGDVDNSARLSSSSLQEVDPRSRQLISLEMEDKWLEKGVIVYLPIRMHAAQDLAALQGTFLFDTDRVQFMGMNAVALNQFRQESYNAQMFSEGMVPFVWFEQEGQRLDAGDIVWNIRLRVLKSAYLSDVLSLGDDFIPATAISDNTPHRLDLQFNSLIEKQQIRLMQNKPNPFTGETTISFFLSEELEASLTIMDMAGRVVYSQKGGFHRGNNDLIIHMSQLGGSGVYLFRLDAPGFSDTKRMVLVSN